MRRLNAWRIISHQIWHPCWLQRQHYGFLGLWWNSFPWQTDKTDRECSHTAGLHTLWLTLWLSAQLWVSHCVQCDAVTTHSFGLFLNNSCITRYMRYGLLKTPIFLRFSSRVLYRSLICPCYQKKKRKRSSSMVMLPSCPQRRQHPPLTSAFFLLLHPWPVFGLCWPSSLPGASTRSYPLLEIQFNILLVVSCRRRTNGSKTHVCWPSTFTFHWRSKWTGTNSVRNKLLLNTSDFLTHPSFTSSPATTVITGCNILSASPPRPVYLGLLHWHLSINRHVRKLFQWTGKDGKIMKEMAKQEEEEEKEGEREREQPGSLAAVCRASREWHFSMWLAYGANCGSATGWLGAENQTKSGWLRQPLHWKGQAEGAEGDTDVNLRPKPPSVAKSWPSKASQVTQKKWRESHDKLPSWRESEDRQSEGEKISPE